MKDYKIIMYTQIAFIIERILKDIPGASDELLGSYTPEAILDALNYLEYRGTERQRIVGLLYNSPQKHK